MTIDTGEKEENAGQSLRKGVPKDQTYWKVKQAGLSQDVWAGGWTAVHGDVSEEAAAGKEAPWDSIQGLFQFQGSQGLASTRKTNIQPCVCRYHNAGF